MNSLDAIFGTRAYACDEEAIAVGLRKQYPWRGTNILTGVTRTQTPKRRGERE